MRRMKVDLSQPESAARPMMTGPSRAAWVDVATDSAGLRDRELVGAERLASREGLSASGGHGHGGGHFDW